MHVPPESPQAPSATVSPTQAAGRRRCLNCNKWIILDGKNPGNDAKRKYCSDECKNEFNRFGSSYGVLKQKLEKLIEATCKTAAQKEVAPQLAKIIETEGFRELMEFAGFVHRSQFVKRPAELKASTLSERITKLGEQLTHAVDEIGGRMAALNHKINLERRARRAMAAPKQEQQTRKSTPRRPAPRRRQPARKRQ